MAVVTTIYNNAKDLLLKGDLDLVNDTFKMALVTSSYTPDFDAHDMFNDITNEITGDGYTAGGKTITNPTVTKDAVNDKSIWDFDDVVWSAATITARAGIVYKVGAGADSSPLVAYINFGTDVSSTAGDYTITIDTDGFLTIG
jgi:hypothetical protein